MKNLAIIPARSGSKGLKNKNIKMLNNLPVIAYTIKAAVLSGLYSEIIVSTDSEEYGKIACEYGATVPYLRKPELATDEASIWDVINDIVVFQNEQGIVYDTITLLQPTSPLRSFKDIQNAFSLFDSKNADAVISVCEVDHSPLWSNTLKNDLSLNGFISDGSNQRRQNLSKYYRLNGAIYLFKIELLEKIENLYSENSYALIMDKSSSVDIDDELDLKFAEFLLKEENK